MRTPRVYISGLHSGPNPSPGVGVARSLRQAFPSAELVGVDYGRASSGIHWPEFDSISLQRPWREANPEVFCGIVEAALESGGLWLPCLDLEAKLLARQLPSAIAAGRILVAPFEALERVSKPCDWAADRLGLKRAESISLSEGEDALHDFCRTHGWRVWAKGPDYEAYPVSCWADLLWASRILRDTWGGSSPTGFLESHVDGVEESIVFAAFKGSLLGAAAMVKRTVTPEGKTWSGSVTPVPTDVLSRVRALSAELAWTGGAEIEMIRDAGGALWLMEVNPRFPAWVHASTIAGTNLPGLLVAAAIGDEGRIDGLARGHAPRGEFTRVVIEIPVRTELPLPTPHKRARLMTVSKKSGVGTEHPSGMPYLSSRVFGQRPDDHRTHSTLAAEPFPGIVLDGQPTPRSVMVPQVLRERMDAASAAAQACSTKSVRVRVAYSTKTNPHAAVLQQARESGLWAECISIAELDSALCAGFSPAEIVLNGPAKGPMSSRGGCATSDDGLRLQAVFCDSLQELAIRIREARANRATAPRVLGIRLRPPFIASRFGVEVESPEVFQHLTSLLRFMPAGVDLGIHFHFASSRMGLAAWLRLCESMVEWARAIEVSTGRNVAVFDVGGGWSPQDWDGLEPTITHLVAKLTERLPHVGMLILEPGKALVQPAGAVVTRVLEVRGGAPGRTLVVDACIADTPDMGSHPHRMWCRSAQRDVWHALVGLGNDSIMGRICMEQDILRESTTVPNCVLPGDYIVIGDCGAYDMSMSFDFGRGVQNAPQ